jgi:hypothetical protein
MKTKILSLLAILTILVVGCKKDDYERMSAVYEGHLETTHGTNSYTYFVEIREVDYGYGLSRIIHMTKTPIDTNSSLNVQITGQDFPVADGSWDRIFYGGYKFTSGTNIYTAGYSSVLHESSGSWRFEPCGSDADHGIKPFSNEEILFAMQELDEALTQIRNPKHQVHMYFWNNKERGCELAKSENARPPQGF